MGSTNSIHQEKHLRQDVNTLKPANDIKIVTLNRQQQQEAIRTKFLKLNSKIPKISRNYHDASTRKSLNSNSNTSITSSKQVTITETNKEMSKNDDGLNTKPANVTPIAKQETKKRAALYTENLPTFYVGVGNNAELIIEIMKKLGWEQVFEKNEDTYRFKWVQSGRSVNWNSFKEGEQIVNHIPNCSLFTNKLNLLCNLQAYEKAQMTLQNKPAHFMPLEEYLPLTYKLDDRVDRETWFATAREDELWICKPVSMNQGKGIYLIRSPSALRQKLEQYEDGQNKKFGLTKPTNRIIQKYINNPLLINKRKFDIRCYMLIASTKPLIVYFHHGYLRLSLYEFTNEDENLVTHLTNQFFQKKDPKYKDIKEDTTWSMEQFNEYINKNVASKKNLPKDWVLNQFTKTMHQIMLQVIHSVRHKLKRKTGYFGIYGYDFMIDDNLKTYLIEINVNPAITCNTDVLVQAIPPAISEGIQIAVECWEKSRSNKKIFPLNSIKEYMLLFSESTSANGKTPTLGERSPTFARRSISSSPSSKATVHTTQLANTMKSIDGVAQRSKSEGVANRVSLSKSVDYRAKTKIELNTTNGKTLDKITEEKDNTTNINNNSTSKHKLRYSSAKLRMNHHHYHHHTAAPPGVELKPATVEVFFRTAPANTQLSTKQELMLKQLVEKKTTLVGQKLSFIHHPKENTELKAQAIHLEQQQQQQQLDTRSPSDLLLFSPYKAPFLSSDVSQQSTSPFKQQQSQVTTNAEKYFAKTKKIYLNQTALLYQLAKSRLAKSMLQSHSTSTITKLPLITQQPTKTITQSLAFKPTPNRALLIKTNVSHRSKYNQSILSAPSQTNVLNIIKSYRI